MILHSTGDGQWTKQMINLAGHWLHGVGGTSADNVFAVGDEGAIYHLAKGAWSLESVVTDYDTNLIQLYGVWGSGPDDMYAVGATTWLPNDSVPANIVSLILHRNAATGVWQQQQVSAGGTYRSVWGSGPNDIYVVGGAIMHSTGDGQWHTQPKPVTQNCGSVGGTGPNDVWVFSGGGLLRSMGDGVWSAAAADCSLMGCPFFGLARGTIGHGVNLAVGYEGLVVDGESWTRDPNPFFVSTAWYRGAWVAGPREAYIVGDNGAIFHSH